ncbi:hypothetical protein ASPACDRAFT_28119 [Aspergillus aculeatus ATCC 16872]|uniref:Mitochondrial export translocase Oxa2 n=1 Tax=Aspergillus aculeatus (strain ATCC 16872 / CBS 172.66 / WB 5094) TaxID=690307 RepID=A0A1L9WW92_ASPA1|nr:uncharacterized protein ASPACDRAFT_28119 [Aspergillus aculeatus ATCC 16872]OJK00525.1 hypothetical protein ASPACDRAFT_28119 [Aspergillus aculeatus ATCC 16872]
MYHLPVRLARSTPLRRATTTRATPPRHQTRHFHPTRPAPFLAEIMDSSWLIHGVHNLSGLPWAYTIPLTALIVRTFIALPIQIYTKIQGRREKAAQPLLACWQNYYRSSIIAKREQQQRLQSMQESSGRRQPSVRTETAVAVARQRKAMFRRLGISRYWKGMFLLPIPAWLSVMETIRAMAGCESGLLAWLLRLVGSDTANRVPVEPTLAAEGALWFPDLLAGDTTGVLPAVLTASILFNIHVGWKVPRLAELAELPRAQLPKHLFLRALRTFVQIMALNVGLSTYLYETPAALLLYWATSSNIATLQNRALDRMMGLDDATKKEPSMGSKGMLMLYRTPVRQMEGAQKQAGVVG